MTARSKFQVRLSAPKLVSCRMQSRTSLASLLLLNADG